MSGNKHWYDNIDTSAVLTVIGVIVLFSSAIGVTLLAPMWLEESWMEPSCEYQVQMYEVADPNVYLSNSAADRDDLQLVHHLKKDFTLVAYTESEVVRIVAPKELDQFVTRFGDEKLRLTSKLLLLREPEGDMAWKAEKLAKKLFEEWEDRNPNWKRDGLARTAYQVLELYDPGLDEAFVVTEADGIVENWVDENYTILDQTQKQEYHGNAGVLYVHNPQEFRIIRKKFVDRYGWAYDPTGERVSSLEKLTGDELGFMSRAHLIDLGEKTYAQEGCWYCHTDQTRTLIQDTVLNGVESEPAPPSAPNEYIYQKITFPGTRRIGPDLSRVGLKRPGRDWHKAHFWAPKTASPGSIMPRFQHFFDDDPRGTSRKSDVGVPNMRFEAVFQYLMTKGTRITAPTRSWWMGKDHIQTKEIIEGRRAAVGAR